MNVQTRMARIESAIMPPPKQERESLRESWRNFYYRVSYFEPEGRAFNAEWQRVYMEAYADGNLDTTCPTGLGGAPVLHRMSESSQKWLIGVIRRFANAARDVALVPK